MPRLQKDKMKGHFNFNILAVPEVTNRADIVAGNRVFGVEGEGEALAPGELASKIKDLASLVLGGSALGFMQKVLSDGGITRLVRQSDISSHLVQNMGELGNLSAGWSPAQMAQNFPKNTYMDNFTDRLFSSIGAAQNAWQSKLRVRGLLRGTVQCGPLAGVITWGQVIEEMSGVPLESSTDFNPLSHSDDMLVRGEESQAIALPNMMPTFDQIVPGYQWKHTNMPPISVEMRMADKVNLAHAAEAAFSALKEALR